MPVLSLARGVAPLKNLVNRWLARVDYFAFYHARVSAQSADGSTVDVIPDDDRLPQDSMRGIELRLGLPGVTVKVQSGCYVMVGFDSGKPNLPYATLWDLGSTTLEINIQASTKVDISCGAAAFSMDGLTGIIKLNNGTLPIARVGDTAGSFPIVGGNPLVLG